MTKCFGLLKSVQASNNKGVTKDIEMHIYRPKYKCMYKISISDLGLSY